MKNDRKSTPIFKSSAAAAGVTNTIRRRVKAKEGVSLHREGRVVPMAFAEDYVIGLLHKTPVTHRPFREGDYIHVSDLIGKCVRKIALIEKLGTGHAVERIIDSHMITYEQGTAIHNFVRSRMINGYPLIVYGKWQCSCGALTTAPMVYNKLSDAHACTKCGKVANNYVELDFRNDEYMIQGSPDLLLYQEQDVCFYPVEIKSMAGGMWKELVRPLPDHIIQGLFYWWLMRENRYNLSSHFSILYVNKEYSFKSPYKEYTMEAEPLLSRLEPYLTDARQLVQFRNGGDVPPRVNCAAPTSPDAKKCSVCATCFALE